VKQKISVPVAIAVTVVVAAAICFGLYSRFMAEPSYSAQDIAAKFKAAGAKSQAPPNMKPQ
jgi:hypothetical protein